MTAELTNLQRAHATAAQRAAEALAGVDLAARCALLGLPAPAEDGTLALRIFAGACTGLVPSDLTSAPRMNLTERVLVLHYLLCECPVVPTGQLISFRDLSGGQFYLGPFTARTTAPLVRRFGNDLAALRNNLARFDHDLLPDLCPTSAVFAARIHAVGRIELTLIYRAGDEEAGASAEVLFDACIKRVFSMEDAAALAGRICLGLL
jgi:hypothetical protein